ncbi:hypothetical protein P6166_11335 [Stenotrophomonas sp. HITSZ_GD]|uniref:hypothetical protein n=1 Tax=Stenotrophomonas sp. HITSZ_GD TaxID=3037248 RepID=UPI00240E7329|nr:hypothetical protein [Stenotrophomonas sp. HITSZ_GD]MDG2525947.1 hypothetical protein [Stenotrophomonas sp. HITSZ_GD]
MKIASTAVRRTVMLLGVSLLAGCSGLCSRGHAPPPPPPDAPVPHRPPQDPAFAQALHACLRELGVETPRDDGPGTPAAARPDREALDACLKEKGVPPPPPPPPRDPALAAAFAACRATLGVPEDGPPPPDARERLHACLKERGVPPPPPPSERPPQP